MIKKNLNILRQLQEAELTIKRLQGEIEDIPRQMEQIEARLEEDSKLLEKEKKKRELSQKKRRRLETELEDLQNKRNKYKGQLLQVKTNKEYQAMLREIENIQEEISRKETKILEELEKYDEIEKAIEEKEKYFLQQKVKAEEEKGELKLRLDEINERCRKLEKHKHHYESKVPQDLLETYNRIKGVRNGIAMAEVKDSICMVCHVRLPPQFYNDIKANKSLFTCPNCNRILYFKG